LDPKYKLDTLDDQEKIDARDLLKSIYTSYQKQYPSIVNQSTKENSKNKFNFEENIFASRSLVVRSTMEENELDDYLSRPRLDLKEISLIWWKQNSDKYPLFSKIAADYLGMMSTSASCERFFSFILFNMWTEY